MTNENEQAYQEERKRAGEYLTKAVKPSGQIIHLDDGKEEVYLRLTFPEMVTLLANWGIERMAQSVEQIFGVKIDREAGESVGGTK